ncbi:MAG: dTDP-4-dehydrorhamnose reductase [Ignavibacteriaceae bacterium]
MGANGMLGQRTVDYYSRFEHVELLTCSVEDKPVFDNIEYVQCDLTKRENVKSILYDFYPDFIINTAAYTNVDKCETEREAAWKLNVKGVEYLAEVCRVLDAHLIHISSDYIFDGARGPYSEKSKPNPLGYYGRTKLASENALRISGAMNTIIRTNVLYGIADSRPDFVRWLINSLRSGNEVRIVTDQINNPTFIDDLVQAISKIVEFRRSGVFNIGGRDFLSRYDFSTKVADFFNLNKTMIKPIKTEDLNQPAPRPLNSGLITIKAESELGFKPHSIEESLAIMKKELSL